MTALNQTIELRTQIDSAQFSWFKKTVQATLQAKKVIKVLKRSRAWYTLCKLLQLLQTSRLRVYYLGVHSVREIKEKDAGPKESGMSLHWLL